MYLSIKSSSLSGNSKDIRILDMLLKLSARKKAFLLATMQPISNNAAR